MSPQEDTNTRVQAYDTTLRDGTQREGISFSCDDKLRVAERLDGLGVSFIEGGWPGSNPKDVEFFERAKDIEWSQAAITAFGSTRRANTSAEDDPNLRTLVESGASVCTVFGKSWDLHVREVLRAELDQNLKMIEESVAYLRAQKRRVVYDAEHFFDGYRADPVYATETLRAAQRGGAEVLVLCDTNGGSLPWDVEEIVRQLASEIGHPLGIHAHNDSGCADANSLAAVRGGAVHVQGTVNGYGERCGNANLLTVVADLELKMGRKCLPAGKLQELREVSRYVSELANLLHDDHLPYVGRSAFAHKGGVHVAAMRRSAESYQHIAPERVGNQSRVVVSELSGRGNVLSKAEEHGVNVAKGTEVEVLQEIKEREARGFAFEAAEASVALMIHRKASDYEAPFTVLDYETSVGERRGSQPYAEAKIKVAVDGKTLHTVADGNGPVSALAEALRKALRTNHPAIDRIQLRDYKVRILDGRNGTEAITRVLIDSRDGDHRWSTVGASSNIIDASLQSLVDAFEYGLALAERARSLRPQEIEQPNS